MTTFRPQNDRQMAMLIARLGGATLEQIGQEFGVTGERVRQLLQKAGWKDRATGKDIGIVPFGGNSGKGNASHYRQSSAREAQRRERQKASDAKRKARRAEQVAALQALARHLQRTPTLSEFVGLMGYAPNNAAILTAIWATWHYRPRGEGSGLRLPHTDRTKRLYRAAGLPAPQKGRPGHILQTDWKSERRRMAMMMRWEWTHTHRRPVAERLAKANGISVAMLVYPFQSSRGQDRTSYRLAAKRLYRAAGVDRPYGA